MATRSAIAIRTEAQGLKATYNHSDGYPTGVGADLQRELAPVTDLALLKGLAEAMRWNATATEHPGSLMKRLAEGEAADYSGFPLDSLYCEWCYLFDFVEDRVEILRGKNMNPEAEHPLFKVDPATWEPEYEGHTLTYFGVAPFWKGSLAEFKALDMRALQSKARETAA